ncbi:MAG: SUMF1/EgtB/PvdO family nonheme iron enzyme [Planctomycetes bacterium]|nr:SUMF1/EgtB/PvdO family nonheme iron enzyme [Planctomycetota bacterium]
MGTERWGRIEDLVEAAAALPAQQQRTFVERQCGSDRALAAAVLAVLDAQPGAQLHRGLGASPRPRRWLLGGALVAALAVGLVVTGFGLAAARSARDELAGRLAEFDTLGTLQHLRTAEARRAELVPPWPERSAAMRDWLATDVAGLRGELRSLQDTVRKLRERAAEPSPEDVQRDIDSHPDRPLLEQRRAELEALRGSASGTRFAELLDQVHALEERVAERRTWTLPTATEQYLHDVLSAAATDLERFLADDAIAVERDLAWAERIDDLTRSHPKATVTWAQAADAIRNADGTVASRRYRDPPIELTPQTGLVPIGMNPVTKLWEFYDLRSAYDPTLPAAPEDLAIPQLDVKGNLPVTAETGIVFVLLPGGRFRMGALDGDEFARDDERPVSDVTLAPFFVARHEVTQGQWRRLSGGATPSVHTQGAGGPESGITEADPVENVTWIDCVRVLHDHGMLLPTEAQWEYAARGGTTTRWWCGGGRESLRGVANLLDKNGIDATGGRLAVQWPDFDDGFAWHAPVDALRPNPFGLFGVHGNVAEWCRDPLASYALPVPSWDDGLRRAGPPDAPRVLRGGSFLRSQVDARSSARNAEAPAFHADDVGLRPVRPLR